MDTKHHLRDRIDHYDLLLATAKKSKSSPLHAYIDFIQDLKKECSDHLHQLKEIDAMAAIEARTSAGLFQLIG